MDHAIIDKVGERFAAVLKERLSPEQFAEMQQLNQTPDFAGGSCCASHNYCDANMAMDEAITKELGRPSRIYDNTDGTEGEDMMLWNAAWDRARERKLI